MEGPDSSTNDVDDAVEAGGDTDNTQDSSKISPNEQTANTANSPAEPATNSEDASVSSGDSRFVVTYQTKITVLDHNMIQ